MNECKILILEDEALIAIDIEMTLEAAGHKDISVCHTADDALRSIEKAVPKMALLDFNLGGGKTSLPVAERLKAIGVPFIFLSGYTKSTVELPQGLKGVRRLAKPFQSAELAAVVESTLNSADEKS